MSHTREPYQYQVEISTEEPNLLRRINILNSALYRIIASTQLKRVHHVDYQGGCIKLVVIASRIDPMLVEGEVHGKISAIGPA